MSDRGPQSHSGWKDEVYSWLLYAVYYVKCYRGPRSPAVDERTKYICGFYIQFIV